MLLTDGGQVGPDFGLHQDADARLEMRQEALHGFGCVPGRPGLHIAIPQQLGAFCAPGGGAMGQQQAHGGQTLAQTGNQPGGRHGLAQRHGMNPDETAVGLGLACITAKALVHGHQIARFGHAPTLEFDPQKGLGQAQHL